jgi:hypothetical protein
MENVTHRLPTLALVSFETPPRLAVTHVLCVVR